MNRFNNDRVIYFPLKVSLIFLVITELLLFIGPVVYDLRKPVLLVFYLALVNLAFYWGYKIGVNRYKPSNNHLSIDAINVIIILGLVLNIMRLVAIWRSHGLSFSINNLILAILNPADAYYSESMELEKSNFLSSLLSPIAWACLPLGIYKWKRLSRFFRLLVIVIAFVEIITWLGIGTRKGLFDVVFITAFSIVASRNDILYDRKKRRKFTRIVVLFVLLFIFYFVFSNLARYNIGMQEINDFTIRKQIRPFYQEHCPFWLLVSLINITGYLCQGYYALSIGLSIGILSPTILGMSWFTMVIANKLGLNPMPYTYLTALESFGIDSRSNWHTIYLWFANDFTFIGVPFIIFIIGYYFAKCWCDSVHNNNDFAVPLFSLFLIMVLYFYANNQVLSFSFIPFVGWFLLYILSRLINFKN